MSTMGRAWERAWRELAVDLNAVVDDIGVSAADALEKGMRAYGRTWQRDMERSINGPLKLLLGDGVKGPNERLASRGGELRRSFGHTFVVSGDALSAALFLFNTARHALVHELGTKGKGGRLPDIRPKRAKFLTIPLQAALTASGRPKGGRARARDWDDTFVHRTDSGSLFIARSVGESLELLYLLKRSVSIAPRLGAARMAEELLTSTLVPRTRAALLSEFAKRKP